MQRAAGVCGLCSAGAWRWSLSLVPAVEPGPTAARWTTWHVRLWYVDRVASSFCTKSARERWCERGPLATGGVGGGVGVRRGVSLPEGGLTVTVTGYTLGPSLAPPGNKPKKPDNCSIDARSADC